MTNKNPYYLVGPSIWPFCTSIGALSLAMGFVAMFFGGGCFLGVSGVLILGLSLGLWWRDVIREGRLGFHTSYVVGGLRDGFVLFLLSEVMFFFSFFWAFLHMSLAPDIALGCVWPPVGLKTFNPYRLPLCGTMVLVGSGVSLTWAHGAIRCGLNNEAFRAMGLTILQGGFFSYLQSYEYYWSSFTIADSAYGSLFYMMTGFHGVHVIFGSGFLVVSWIRIYKGHFSPRNHFGFKVCSWYWHFVDVVWIGLYLVVYCWGS
uniref:cytochrome c oxidase subunit III n=1 Tax=Xenostrobus securis TaxID=1289581 RepID=UPI00226D3EBD|nr:cytochrome c oxidase subunit III [Xenostrobus securis]UZG66003.1 cytochrome c oxidase subunit 3 [Xenostrobus securis]